MPGCRARQIHDPEFTSEEIEEAARSTRLLAMDIQLGRGGSSRCHHCFPPERPRSKKELSQEEVRDVVEQARELGARKISIFGAEPMTYRHTSELLRFMRSHDLAVEMFTSGGGITADFAREFFANRIRVVLKTDPWNEGAQGVLGVRKGGREVVQQALRYLREAGYPSEEGLLEVAAEDRELSPCGQGCMRHKFSCLVRWQGDVTPCIGLGIPIGNIREQTLCEIIKDSEVLEDLRDHTHTIRGPCASCEEAAICYGCRGAAYQLTGDYLASDPSCWKNAERQEEIVRLPIAAADVIPQKLPMRVIDDLVRTGERSGEISVKVSDEMPFVGEDGVVDEAAYFEMMAQSVAALNGFKHLGRAASSPGGYLVGARKLEILGRARVGDTLNISVYKDTRFGSFGIVKGRISRDETVLARGEIKIWNAGWNGTGPAGLEE